MTEPTRGPIEFSIHQPMISGQDDALERTYNLHTEKPSREFPNGRRWLVAAQESAADNIYVEGVKGSDGFGGATLTFDLTDGTKVSLTGPWKTGAEGLFKATGIDVRNSYVTFGIVAFEKEHGKWPGPDFYRDVIHLDGSPTLGAHSRIRDIAQAAANRSRRRVYHASVSKGGGHAGWEDPKDGTP